MCGWIGGRNTSLLWGQVGMVWYAVWKHFLQRMMCWLGWQTSPLCSNLKCLYIICIQKSKFSVQKMDWGENLKCMKVQVVWKLNIRKLRTACIIITFMHGIYNYICETVFLEYIVLQLYCSWLFCTSACTFQYICTVPNMAVVPWFCAFPVCYSCNLILSIFCVIS